MRITLALATCVSLLAACSRSPIDKPSEDKPLVLKYITWSGEKNGGTKGEGATFSYDAQNRLVSVLGLEDGMRTSYDNKGNILMSEVWTKDVLSRIYIAYENGLPKTGVERYFLRANNRRIQTVYYEYAIENELVTRMRLTDSAGIMPTSDIFIRYRDGNVVSTLRAPVSTPTDTVTYYEWTYGAKRNPYTALKAKYYTAPTGAGQLFQNKNEPQTMHVRIPSTGTVWKQLYAYQYDADGYPVREAEVTEGSTDTLVTWYEYRR